MGNRPFMFSELLGIQEDGYGAFINNPEAFKQSCLEDDLITYSLATIRLHRTTFLYGG